MEFKNKAKHSEKFTSLELVMPGEDNYQMLMRSNHCFILADDKKVYPVLRLKSLKDIEKNPKIIFTGFTELKTRFKNLMISNLGIVFKT